MVAVDWALAKKAYDQVAAASGGDEEEEANEEGNQDDGEGDSDDDLEDEDVEEDVDDGEDIAVENLEDERKKSLSLLDEVMAKADEQKVEGQKKGKTGNVKASKPDESEKTKKKDSGVEGPGAKQEAKKKPDGSVPGAAKINGAVFVRGLHLDVTKMVNLGSFTVFACHNYVLCDLAGTKEQLQPP